MSGVSLCYSTVGGELYGQSGLSDLHRGSGLELSSRIDDRRSGAEISLSGRSRSGDVGAGSRSDGGGALSGGWDHVLRTASHSSRRAALEDPGSGQRSITGSKRGGAEDVAPPGGMELSRTGTLMGSVATGSPNRSKSGVELQRDQLEQDLGKRRRHWVSTGDPVSPPPERGVPIVGLPSIGRVSSGYEALAHPETQIRPHPEFGTSFGSPARARETQTLVGERLVFEGVGMTGSFRSRAKAAEAYAEAFAKIDDQVEEDHRGSSSYFYQVPNNFPDIGHAGVPDVSVTALGYPRGDGRSGLRQPGTIDRRPGYEDGASSFPDRRAGLVTRMSSAGGGGHQLQSAATRNGASPNGLLTPAFGVSSESAGPPSLRAHRTPVKDPGFRAGDIVDTQEYLDGVPVRLVRFSGQGTLSPMPLFAEGEQAV